ncbi:hypothetical protein R3P38DRAFT_973671 [Favolaschia claudopus]|uniref:Uncharacterized protein n=1 Tax=Favolaschia claudopus TaxID=2862362 RepID=A0AAW0E4X2_9AGAR
MGCVIEAASPLSPSITSFDLTPAVPSLAALLSPPPALPSATSPSSPMNVCDVDMSPVDIEYVDDDAAMQAEEDEVWEEVCLLDDDIDMVVSPVSPPPAHVHTPIPEIHLPEAEDEDDSDDSFDDIPLSPLVHRPAGDAAEEEASEAYFFTMEDSPGQDVEGYEYDEEVEMHEHSHWSIGTTNAALSPPPPMTPGGAGVGLTSHWSVGTTNAAMSPRTPGTPYVLPSPPPLPTSSPFSPPSSPSPLSSKPPLPPPPSDALRSRWSVSTTNSTSTPYSPTPALRSRWSSSTLSSLHSSHATTSPRFGFRRYLRAVSSSGSSSASSASVKSGGSGSKGRVRPMGSTSPSVALVSRGKPKGKGKGRKGKLTVGDIRVPHYAPPPPPVPAFPTQEQALGQFVVGPPPAESVLGRACGSPDVFSAGKEALWTAYATQRSPRRRVSQSSSSTTSSPSSPCYEYTQRRRGGSLEEELVMSPARSSFGGGHARTRTESDCGSSVVSGMSGVAGTRRKPIPVEMFLK